MSPVVLAAVLALFIYIRVRLRDMPLERDEGEYAYAGQLILQGIPPYKLAYNMKLPGTYAAYAVVLWLFGQTASGIHRGLLVVNTATTVMMFFLGKKLTGEVGGMAAAAAYAVLSSGSFILGMQGHATHYVVFAAVAGFLVLFEKDELTKHMGRLFWSGILLGLSFLMKQPGLLFAIFAGSCLGIREVRSADSWRIRLRRLASFKLGVVLPLVVTCLILWKAGVFPRFWFWVFDYARAYAGINSWREGWLAFKQTAGDVVGPAVGIWVLAAAGVTAILWDDTLRKHAVFLLGLLASSFLGVSAGLYFRPHYFILMLPALALLVGAAVSSATNQLLRRKFWRRLAAVPALFLASAFSYAVVAQADFFFRLDGVSASHLIYPLEPFTEARAVGDYIRLHSSPTATVAVLGAEPEIYFYARRHSATGFIYSFPLLEKQPFANSMQKEMMAEVEAAKPEYLVVQPGAWLLNGTPGLEPRRIWTQNFASNYAVAGLVQWTGFGNTEVHWGEFAQLDHPDRVVMFVLRRRAL